MNRQMRIRLIGIAMISLLAVLFLSFASMQLRHKKQMQSTKENTSAHTVRRSTRPITKENNLPTIAREEQTDMRRMLKPTQDKLPDHFEQTVWVQDMHVIIAPRLVKKSEADPIARWVYLYSHRFDLSPELVMAVMAVESSFDRFSISPAGAIGLMQVMPFWKEQMGAKNDNLFDIETNIHYGCAILRMYMNRYRSLSSALAAYNGSLGSRKYPMKVYKQMRRFKANAGDL